jgi:MoaA/NifB/PqqE/SkfB family radical SAM enzyme
MLNEIHLLLTYACNLECDHCFVYSKPNAKGTFTINQIKEILKEAIKIRTIKWIYLEGGEAFLFYPLMLEAIKLARDLGFKTGVVTNAYWSTSKEDAELWLKPLSKLKISDISISDDSFHREDEKVSPAKVAIAVAKELGLPINSICVEKPVIKTNKTQSKGASITGGSIMFRGRAVEKLIKGVPKKSWNKFKECPYEDLKNPKRIHIDSYGNIHLCQGLSMGNIWEKPLSKIVKKYNSDSHPICKYLIKGGPALLAKKYNIRRADKYIDACHLCYLARLSLIDRFPQYLAPKQVYGL